MTKMRKITKVQTKAFRVKINDCFKELRECGVMCRKNFSCCQSCGHSEIGVQGYEGSYVFYHTQTSESLSEGEDSVYLAHSIADDERERVIAILKRYGSDWEGEDNSTIEIPFINYTPEQIAERKREETDRQIRIAQIDALKKSICHESTFFRPRLDEDGVWDGIRLERILSQ